MNKNIVIGVLVAVTLLFGYLAFSPKAPLTGAASGPAHFQKESFLQGLAAGPRDQLSISNTGSITLSNGSSASIFSSGFLVAGQGVVSSASGYGTTTAGSASVPVATMCLGQTWLDPQGTAAITLTLPKASDMFTGCSGATAGAWSYQLIDNESPNAITLATTTGGANMSIYFATGTPATSITYPPKIQASTTAQVLEMFTDSTHMSLYITQMSKAAGY